MDDTGTPSPYPSGDDDFPEIQPLSRPEAIEPRTRGLRRLILPVRRWLKKHKVGPILGLILSIGVMVGIVIIYWLNPDIIMKLEPFGYLGAFIISLLINATIILPVNALTILIALGTVLPSPVLVGLAGGLGAGIGETTGYIVGRSGRRLLIKSKVYSRVEKWVMRWGWIGVFVLSIFPFAFDVVGIIAGGLRMPFWKFFIATWLGRTVLYVVVVNFGSFGLKCLPFLN